eukprot:IDg9045t1
MQQSPNVEVSDIKNGARTEKLKRSEVSAVFQDSFIVKYYSATFTGRPGRSLSAAMLFQMLRSRSSLISRENCKTYKASGLINAVSVQRSSTPHRKVDPESSHLPTTMAVDTAPLSAVVPANIPTTDSAAHISSSITSPSPVRAGYEPTQKTH